MCAKVASLPIESVKDFKWSIRPIITWARVLGIDLNLSSSSKCRRHLTLIAGVAIFLFDVSFFAIFFASLPFEVGRVTYTYGDTYSKTFSANVMMDYIQIFVPTIAVHLIMLVFSGSRWPDLCQSIELVLTELKVGPAFYHRIRRQAIARIIYTITTMCFLAAAMAIHNLSMTNYSLTFCLFEVWLNIQIYPNLGIAVFCACASIISRQIETIKSEIGELADKTQPLFVAREKRLVDQINTWKNLHLIICNATEKLNGCFGSILLFNVIFTFTGVISTCFYIYIGIINGKATYLTVLAVGFIANHLINLMLMTYFADCIKHQSWSMAAALRRLRMTVPSRNDREEINEFISDVTTLTPNIHAMGFFRVTQGLVPKMIGTTLTYVIILCQIRATE